MGESQAIAIGAYAAGAGELRFAVYGLGSCVAMVLFDPQAGVGGLAHILLPGPRPAMDGLRDLPAKYADEAVTVLSEGLQAAGGDPRRACAGVVGGARLFASESPLESGVGARNIQGALGALGRAGVPVRWRDTGGGCGRSLRFDLPEGRLFVRTLGGGWRELEAEP